MDTRNIGKKAGSVVVAAAGIGLGVWASLVLADILTFLYFYWSVTNVLQNHGLPEYGAKLVAVLFAGIIGLIANGILWNMIKRNNRRWVPALAGIMSLWFVIMFVVASPYESGPFNIFNGQPGKYYRDQYGRIHTLPRGAKVGDHGEPALIFNKESAQEYQRQTGNGKMTGPPSSGLWRKLFKYGLPHDTELQMEVEKIGILPDKTILYFAVRRTNNSRLGRFYKPHGWNYLSDETGQVYDLILDNADYPDWVDAKTHEEKITSDKKAATRIVRPDEVYRFTNEYPPLKPGIRQLRLHDSRFAQVDLDYQLSLARNQAEIQKQKEVVESSNPDEDTLIQPPRTESQNPNPVVIDREPPVPINPLFQPPSPSSAAPPLSEPEDVVQSPKSPPEQRQSPVVDSPKPQVPPTPSEIPDSDWVGSKFPERPELYVFEIRVVQGKTVLDILARTKQPIRTPDLSNGRTFATHLMDEGNNVYKFSKGGQIFKFRPNRIDTDPYKPYSILSYFLEVGELYMFRMSFDELKENSKELTFCRSGYPSINLDLQLQRFHALQR